MPFITLNNLTQFFKNLLSKNLVFTKALTIAPDLTKEEGVTKIGSYWASDGQIQQPLLTISNNETSGGVFYRGKEVATKDDITAGGGNITVDDTLSDTSTNPVQNKVIKGALDNLLSTSSSLDGNYVGWDGDQNLVVGNKTNEHSSSVKISPYGVICGTDSAYVQLSNGHISINGSELWIE
jgi:hypothetical protein